MAAVRAQSAARGWLARRAAKRLRAARALQAKHTRRTRLGSRRLSAYAFAKCSAAFQRAFGKSEEQHYEEVARAVPELAFLVLPKSDAHASGAAAATKDEAAKSKRALQAAVRSRDFRELSAALALARDCGYRGPEVQQADAVAARIRTIHLKQLEAERLMMAGKLTARATATGY